MFPKSAHEKSNHEDYLDDISPPKVDLNPHFFWLILPSLFFTFVIVNYNKFGANYYIFDQM